MKNLSLWVPLDAKNKFSRVLEISFQSKADYKKTQIDKDFINSVTKDILFSKFQSS